MILESHNCKYTKYNTDAVKVFLVTRRNMIYYTQYWLPEFTNLKFTLYFQTLIHNWMQRIWRKLVRSCQILNLELVCDVLKLDLAVTFVVPDWCHRFLALVCCLTNDEMWCGSRWIRKMTQMRAETPANRWNRQNSRTWFLSVLHVAGQPLFDDTF